MEDAEVYEAVKAITQLVNECSIKLDLATSSHANNEAFVVKQKTDSYHSTLSEEEIDIINKMLEDRR